MRILIADDEALTRMGLRTMLRALGHTVVGAAADGLTALRLACETRPDLAVLDIRMPGMDGLAVAEAIGQQCPAPVVMLTAYSERELVQQAAATDTVQAYLVKPIRLDRLRQVVGELLDELHPWPTARAAQRGAAIRRS